MCYKPTPDIKMRKPFWASRPRTFIETYLQGEEDDNDNEEDEEGYCFTLISDKNSISLSI